MYKLFLLLAFLVSLLPLPSSFGRGSASLLSQGGPLLPSTVEKSLGFVVSLSALFALPLGMHCSLVAASIKARHNGHVTFRDVSVVVLLTHLHKHSEWYKWLQSNRNRSSYFSLSES